jgi:hypothetical protein
MTCQKLPAADAIFFARKSVVNRNPRLFEPREASEPYSRGQWDSALKATPHSPKGDVRALEPTARSDAHGFRSHRPRSLLTCSTIVGLGLMLTLILYISLTLRAF